MQNTSTSEIASTRATTTGMTLNSWPQASSKGNNAKKVTIVVSAPTSTGPATARTPAMDAATPFCPSSRCRAMLSPTTTASSTTMPVTTKNANIVSWLMLTPAASKNTSAPRNEMGMPMAIHRAMRRSKIASRSRNTSTAPMTALLAMTDIRSEIHFGTSSQSETRAPGVGT